MVENVNPLAPGASSAFFVPSFIIQSWSQCSGRLLHIPSQLLVMRLWDDVRYFLVMEEDKNDCAASFNGKWQTVV